MANVIKKEELFPYHVSQLTNQFDFSNMISDLILEMQLDIAKESCAKSLRGAIDRADGKFDYYLGDFGTFSYTNGENDTFSTYLCKVPPTLKKI